MNKIKTGIFFFLIFSFLSGFYSKTAEKEALIKAAYLEKFARFTEWPDDYVGKRFDIGVIGKSPFNGALEMLAKNFQIKGKPVSIHYITNIDEAVNYEMLFICNSEKSQLRKILDKIEHLPILSVGDTDGFTKLGVHFNFYLTEEGTIHFEVNPEKISQSGLKADMYLISIGKVVD